MHGAQWCLREGAAACSTLHLRVRPSVIVAARAKPCERVAVVQPAVRLLWNSTRASTRGEGSYRTGSVAGSPVSFSAAAIASRAAASLRSKVFSATAITGAGLMSAMVASYSLMRSVSDGVGSQSLCFTVDLEGWPHRRNA